MAFYSRTLLHMGYIHINLHARYISMLDTHSTRNSTKFCSDTRNPQFNYNMALSQMLYNVGHIDINFLCSLRT